MLPRRKLLLFSRKRRGCIHRVLRLFGAMLFCVAALPGLAVAQSGEVVFYGFAGDHVEPEIRAFNKHYPNITVRAITLQGPAVIARLRAEKDHRAPTWWTPPPTCC